jgi:hypothetical protein
MNPCTDYSADFLPYRFSEFPSVYFRDFLRRWGIFSPNTSLAHHTSANFQRTKQLFVQQKRWRKTCAIVQYIIHRACCYCFLYLEVLYDKNKSSWGCRLTSITKYQPHMNNTYSTRGLLKADGFFPLSLANIHSSIFSWKTRALNAFSYFLMNPWKHMLGWKALGILRFLKVRGSTCRLKSNKLKQIHRQVFRSKLQKTIYNELSVINAQYHR